MAPRSVAEKLLIRPGTTVWTSDASRLALLGDLPEGVTPVSTLSEAATAVVFADSAAAVRDFLATNRDALTQPNALWIAYPKGNRAGINRDTLWPIVAGFGMRPITQVALDDVWSALRFRPLKEGESQFTGVRES
jgi:hypothetical protein